MIALSKRSEPRSIVDIDWSNVSKAIADVTTSAKEAQDAFDSVSRAWMMMSQSLSPDTVFTPSGKKRITDIEIRYERDVFSTPIWSTPENVLHPGQWITHYLDQDGAPLPYELIKRVEDEARTKGELNVQQMNQILAEYNEEVPPAEHPIDGHLSDCPYRASHHFACHCQPPTIFGNEIRWHCVCCELPRAPKQFGLCAMCQRHQYSDPDELAADHRAVR